MTKGADGKSVFKIVDQEVIDNAKPITNNPTLPLAVKQKVAAAKSNREIREKNAPSLLEKVDRAFTNMKGNSSLKDPMEGEDGLKSYSNGLNNTGNFLKVASLATGPAAPIVAGLGEGLSIGSDLIDSGLDLKNKDNQTAGINIGIRVATFGTGKYFEYKFEKFQGMLPKSLGIESSGEKAVKVGIDLGLDQTKDNLTSK